MHQANVNQQKTGIAILISDKADSKATLIWHESVYSKMIKGAICTYPTLQIYKARMDRLTKRNRQTHKYSGRLTHTLRKLRSQVN